MRKNNIFFGICGCIYVFVFYFELLFGGQLNRTSGLYDFDGDGHREVLVISSTDRMAALIEFKGKVISDTVWSYTLPNDTYFTDISILDVDKNGQPDLVASAKISADNNDDGWLYIFQGTMKSFSNKPLVAGQSGLEFENIRPLNLSRIHGNSSQLSVSFGTPVRKTLVFEPVIQNEKLKIKNAKILSDPLIQNGFGHMYSGGFVSFGSNYVAQFSAEINTLKIAIFNSNENFNHITTEILNLGNARGIIGAEVQPYNDLKNGEQGLLIPFRTGEVKILNVQSGKVTLDDSEFSHEDLFLEMKDPNESEILDLVSSRIESGFYNKTRSKEDYLTDNNRNKINLIEKPIDGPTLVDYLNEAGIVRKSKFQRKIDIPVESADMSSEIWAAKASVKVEQIDSTMLSLNDSIFRNPIPDEDKEIAFHKTVFGPSDSSIVAETWDDTLRNVLVPESIDLSEKEGGEAGIDLYYVMVMTPSKSNEDRYIFDGEAPFGINVAQVPTMGEPTHFQHSVSANTSYLRRGNDYDFAYTLKEQLTDSITTLTMVHDMQTNIIFMSISPESDSVSQSYQPEAFDPKLFEFPDYFFEGFPTSLGMDFKDKLIRFSFDDSGDSASYQGLYLSATTPSIPSQSLAVFLNEGILQAIRGEVKVRENGSKKITTQFDIAGYHEPTAMFSRLIQEDFSDSLKTNLLQGAYLEEPLFGPSGKLPKISREKRIPEVQFDQKNPDIPVDPLKGIYPEGQGINTTSKAKIETVAPEPQSPVDNPSEPDMENMIPNLKSDSLRLEKSKDGIPKSINSDLNDLDNN